MNLSSLTKSPALPIIWLYAALLAGIYHFAFSWLIQHDWPREDYNYAYLIPLVVLYLVWEKRRDLAAVPASSTWKGILPFIMGILLFWAGQLGGEIFSVYLSSWLIVSSLLWVHWGWKKLRIIAFPLLLSLSMFPLPHFLNTKLTFGLKLMSSSLGVSLIRLSGKSAYQEGNIIDLGFTQLQVLDACSGLRFFFPLILMGILLGYFYRLRLWKGALLALSAVPLSIFMNGIRIALTGIIYRFWGAEAAEGFFHGFSGWLVFMGSFGVLIGAKKVLNWLFPEKPLFAKAIAQEGKAPAAAIPQALSMPTAMQTNTEMGFAATSKAKYHLLPMVLLGLTSIFLNTVDFHEKAPPRKTFAQFPLQVGNWTGTPQTLEQKFIKELDLSDYIMMDFRDSAGRLVNFYAAYYQSQKMGESIHSPETCLPGSGWVFRPTGEVLVPLPDGKGLMAKRAVMEKGDSAQIVYFWVSARGRILTNVYEMKLFNMWDALTQKRTDAALVRIITPISEKENPDRAEARLQAFVRTILPPLSEFIP
ncbi:MAG: VPLPA-CTERM-specific exosortase XrtD [Syntrophaceae bacterium]|nr:VPLPA-CTERM-specific exosortase XrtD [Syntrophaceae bacterium]